MSATFQLNQGVSPWISMWHTHKHPDYPIHYISNIRYRPKQINIPSQRKTKDEHFLWNRSLLTPEMTSQDRSGFSYLICSDLLFHANEQHVESQGQEIPWEHWSKVKILWERGVLPVVRHNLHCHLRSALDRSRGSSGNEWAGVKDRYLKIGSKLHGLNEIKNAKPSVAQMLNGVQNIAIAQWEKKLKH